MDKKILSQYCDIQEEIKDIRARIELLERDLEKINEEGAVHDVVKGGMGGIQNFHIEGFPTIEYDKVRFSLQVRKMKLAELEYQLLEVLNDVDDFINSIDDSRMRQIIRYRFIDNLSWQQIANRIKGNTEGSIKMAFKRFMDSYDD